MNEILPGVFHWTAQHPRIGLEVSSYFVADSSTVIDPMTPAEGFGWFQGRAPRTVALTNRHHDRDAAAFCREFDVGAVLVPEAGLHEFEAKPIDVRGYVPGEEIAAGIVAHEVGAICPDDMALEIRSAGALAMADGLVRVEEGIGFVPDAYMDDPRATKQALRESLERLLAVDFDTLLFAHGPPMVGGAKQALREFIAGDAVA